MRKVTFLNILLSWRLVSMLGKKATFLQRMLVLASERPLSAKPCHLQTSLKYGNTC